MRSDTDVTCIAGEIVHDCRVCPFSVVGCMRNCRLRPHVERQEPKASLWLLRYAKKDAGELNYD